MSLLLTINKRPHLNTKEDCLLTVVHESEERLLDEQLRVEDHQFGTGRHEIVAFVELEKLDENLIFVVF